MEKRNQSQTTSPRGVAASSLSHCIAPHRNISQALPLRLKTPTKRAARLARRSMTLPRNLVVRRLPRTVRVPQACLELLVMPPDTLFLLVASPPLLVTMVRSPASMDRLVCSPAMLIPCGQPKIYWTFRYHLWIHFHCALDRIGSGPPGVLIQGFTGSLIGAPGLINTPSSRAPSFTKSRAGMSDFYYYPGVFPGTPGSTTSRFPGTPIGASSRTFTLVPARGFTQAPDVDTGFVDNDENNSDRSHKRHRDDAA
jgi:hypothetical protein